MRARVHDLAAEAVGLRPVPEKFGDQSLLRVRQRGRMARRGWGDRASRPP